MKERMSRIRQIGWTLAVSAPTLSAIDQLTRYTDKRTAIVEHLIIGLSPFFFGALLMPKEEFGGNPPPSDLPPPLPGGPNDHYWIDTELGRELSQLPPVETKPKVLT